MVATCVRRLLTLVVLVAALGAAEQHWHSGPDGTGVDEILATWPLREPAPVVVAVLDSGFDLDHPALAPALWTNAAEAAGEDDVDEDANGFTDDRHGWSFLSASDGTPLIDARMEVARYHAELAARVEAGELTADDPTHQAVAMDLRRARAQWEGRLQRAYLMAALRRVALADLLEAGVEPDADPESVEAPLVRAALAALTRVERDPMGEHAEAVVDDAVRWLEVGYNPDFDESAILGDDPDDPSPEGYGAPELSVGWRDGHGTMAAGVIGGVRWEDGATHGLCPGARLMLLRTTPHGDERDKDVANGIRYAVANGARVINMSFGKPWSPQKAWVDAAMREAEAAGVLVVHAAGNDAGEITADNCFPNPHHAAGRFANWLVVGASGPDGGIAFFSNWSPTEVDLLAPGIDIRSPDADGGVGTHDGTSCAAPCVSGVAALLWSQFPTASVDQVKAAILSGARPMVTPQARPGDRDAVEPTALCASGAVLDAAGALVALARTMGDESILPPGLRAGALDEAAPAVETAPPTTPDPVALP